jgi:hypothetical protein
MPQGQGPDLLVTAGTELKASPGHDLLHDDNDGPDPMIDE